MADRRSKREALTERPMVHGERVDAILAEFIKAADEAVARQNAGSTALPEMPNREAIDAVISDDMRRAIEREFEPVVAGVGGEINPRELEQELIKKALTNLRARTLKSLASTAKVAVSGTKEELARRIGREFLWDTQRIARLVAAGEAAEFSPTAHSTRMFSLQKRTVLGSAVASLSYVADRYVKVGLAKWIGFGSTTLHEETSSAELPVSYRAYQAEIEAEGNRGGRLRSSDRTVKFAVRLLDDADVLEVDDASIVPARTGARGVAKAAGLTLLHYTPGVDSNSLASGSELHNTTTFMLDFWYNRLRSSGKVIGVPDVKIAKFKMLPGDLAEDDNLDEDDGDENDGAPNEHRPRLHGVKLDGRYLLDSPQACRYMAIEQRPLLDVTALVRVHEETFTGHFQIRITIESDHVAIATGYNLGDEQTLTVHELCLSALRAQLQHGLSDELRVAEMAEAIREQAQASPDSAAPVLG